jgi:hypothetical protein
MGALEWGKPPDALRAKGVEKEEDKEEEEEEEEEEEDCSFKQ